MDANYCKLKNANSLSEILDTSINPREKQQSTTSNSTKKKKFQPQDSIRMYVYLLLLPNIPNYKP